MTPELKVLYRNVFSGYRLEVVEVKDDGTYVIKLSSPVVRFDHEQRRFVSTSESLCYLSPRGASWIKQL